MGIIFSADLHFNHRNIIKYCDRPFEAITDMNELLIANWNKIIGTGDTIYILGDVGIGNLEQILNRLHGNKILIIGSHDKELLKPKYKTYFSIITPMLVIHTCNVPITLCHYAMRTWYKAHYNAWHLYGHSHGRLESQGKSLDVGVDNAFKLIGEYRPFRLHEIRALMKELPDNVNLVKEER